MDPVANMLSQIRNALAVKKPLVSVPYSDFKHRLANLLIRKSYLLSVEKVGRGVKRYLKIELNYGPDGRPAIEELKKVSKPGQRIYIQKDKIMPIKSGLGRLIISTSEGLLFGDEAKRKGLGGEVICEIF